ncbi:MAG TPA: ABC transporter permease, partial [Vicinamibacterales bacterium]
MVMDSIRHDLRYALRSLRRSPAYGTAAVLSFAIGIGACTAVFGILDAVMLRKLPVRQPEDLVLFAGAAVDYPLLDRLRTLTSSFDGIAAVILVDRGSAAVTRPGERLQVGGVSVALVTGNYFRVLGADAATGRTLDENDDRVPEG